MNTLRSAAVMYSKGNVMYREGNKITIVIPECTMGRSTDPIKACLFCISDAQFWDQKVNIIRQQVTSATLI